jgi:hypothetical protein
MSRSRLLLVTLLVVAGLVLVAASYEMGRRMQLVNRNDRSLAYTKAVLAFAHYKHYADIADYLEQKCYDDAVTMARFMRDSEKSLVAANLRRTANDPTLLEYIKFRDPELLKSVLAASTPEPQPITTRCVPRSFRAK